jgi:uncharacterized protein (TIGR02466 family)
MGLLHLFPTVIYSHDSLGISPLESKEYINYLNNINYTSLSSSDHISENDNLLNNSLFDNLKSNILHHCKNYLISQKHKFEDLQFSCSWAYISKKGNIGGNLHHHSNAYVSGVYYLTEGTDLIFHDFRYEELYGFRPEYDTPSKDPLYSYCKIPIKKDQLILFPSNLAHAIDHIQDNKRRISIAFNIIPKGKFGKFTSSLYINGND